MKKIKETEIEWQKVKLISDGGSGVVLKYGYLFTEQGRTFLKTITAENDLAPHDDLINLIKSIRPLVAKVESIDYARTILTMPGFDATDLQKQITEGAVQNAMQNVIITGLHFSKKKNREGCIVSYNKYDKNDLITGHVTNWISFDGIEYEVEEELADIIKDLKVELFDYEFNSKYADFEQLTIEHENYEEEEEDPDITDVEFEESEDDDPKD